MWYVLKQAFEIVIELFSAKAIYLSITSTECTDSQFRCTDGFCLPKSLVCDSNADCSDGSDEAIPCGMYESLDTIVLVVRLQHNCELDNVKIKLFLQIRYIPQLILDLPLIKLHHICNYIYYLS